MTKPRRKIVQIEVTTTASNVQLKRAAKSNEMARLLANEHGEPLAKVEQVVVNAVQVQ